MKTNALALGSPLILALAGACVSPPVASPELGPRTSPSAVETNATIPVAHRDKTQDTSGPTDSAQDSTAQGIAAQGTMDKDSLAHGTTGQGTAGQAAGTAPAVGGQAGAASAGGADSAAAIGKKLANPLSDVWALFTEFDFTSSDGRAVGTPNNSVGIIFQPIMPVNLSEGLTLITRPTLPIFLDQPVPSREFDRRTGLGNLTLPLLVAPKKGFDLWGGDCTIGVGPTLSFPTATTPSLGTRAWEAGPAAVGVWKDDKNTAGILGQYWWSYSTYNGDSHTSHGSILYFFIHELGNAWQVGCNPTITFDNEAPSGNKWNVPVGLMVAKTTKVGKQIVKFQLAVERSVISQDDYGKQSQIRFNIIPVIKSPQKKPLF